MAQAQLELDGSVIEVEVDRVRGPNEAGGFDEVKVAFSDALEVVDKFAEEFAKTVKKLSSSPCAPSEATITFGLKISAESGWIIAKVAGEGHFDVALAWKHGGKS
jgi:hypothetical protein